MHLLLQLLVHLCLLGGSALCWCLLLPAAGLCCCTCRWRLLACALLVLLLPRLLLLLPLLLLRRRLLLRRLRRRRRLLLLLRRLLLPAPGLELLKLQQLLLQACMQQLLCSMPVLVLTLHAVAVLCRCANRLDVRHVRAPVAHGAAVTTTVAEAAAAAAVL
jgi:hypothetical protein